MKKFIFFKENNLLLINFDKIFFGMEIECLNELDKYNLIDDYKINLSKRDVKKIIYHHVIHGICEEIISNKHKYKKAIIFPPKIRSLHEMAQFCDIEDLQILLQRLLNKLRNSLPFLIYFSKEYIFENEIDESGETEDLVNILSEMCDIIDNKSFTFEKIKKFTSQFDLKFLTNDYFNSLKTKLLLR